MLRASLSAIPIVPNDPNVIQIDLAERVLSMIESNPAVSRREISENLGISERKTRDALKKMQDAGILKREGSTRGIWIIVK